MSEETIEQESDLVDEHRGGRSPAVYRRRTLNGAVRCLLLTLVGVMAVATAARAQAFNVGMFRPWPGYLIPNGNWLTGDFNGDGKGDIFHAADGPDVAHTWLSFGDGSFSVQTFRPWDGYTMPNGVWMAGDFNGDRKTDIFHAVDDADVAHTWLSNGNGTFAVQTFRPWNGYTIPNGVWMTGDFNGDGKTDIFHAVDNTAFAHVWLSNGNGTFAVQSFSPWNGYTIPNGVWMTGDFNGDGKTDVFHAVATAGVGHTWLSNGNGTFAVQTFRPWDNYTIPNGVWMTGDFNADGKTDVFHAVADTDFTHVWLSNGNGTFAVQNFQPWSGYAIPNGVWMTGDWNGDGATDVLHGVEDTDFAHIWVSNRNGTFAVQTFRPWNGYGIPNGLWLPADITGDGKTDVIHAVASGDFVHPWMSLLANPQQAFQLGLEVTQAVQGLAHDVPLVAGKATIVRAYLDAPPAGPPLTVQGTLTVRDVATNAVTTVASSAAVTLSAAQNGQLQAKRNSLALSLNFTLPAALTTAGNREFTLTGLTTASGANLPCSNCAAGRVSVPFLTSSPLRLRMVGLRYNTGIPPATVVNQPAAVDFNLLSSWLGRALPIAQVNASQTTILSNDGWPFICNLANAQLQAMRATEVAGGTDGRTHYLGLVSNAGGFMIGCSSGIPTGGADPTTVASGPTGNPSGTIVPANVAGDTDASFGDWYGGHELAHTFGRLHPGFCPNNSSDDDSFPNPNGQISDNANTHVGWDAGDGANAIAPQVLPGTTTLDIMTYCNQPQWFSAYAYRGVRDRLNAENPSGGGAPAGSAGGISRERTFITPAGLQFAVGCACPHVKPALEKPADVHTAAKAPAKAVTGRDLALPAPKPAGERPSLPQAAGVLAYPEPAAKAPARVETLVAIFAAQPETAPEPMRVEMKDGRFVSLVATLNLTRLTGKFRYVNHVSRAMVPTGVARDHVVLRFTDRRGRIVGEFPQVVRVDSDVRPGYDRTALVAAVVPEMEGVGRVDLLIGDRVVDSIDVPSRAPTLSGLRFAPPAKEGERTLRWEGTSAAKARLLYLVELSPDGAAGWETAAVGAPIAELSFSAEQLHRYSGWFVRVTANDGYNDSAPLTLRLGYEGPK